MSIVKIDGKGGKKQPQKKYLVKLLNKIFSLLIVWDDFRCAFDIQKGSFDEWEKKEFFEGY